MQGKDNDRFAHVRFELNDVTATELRHPAIALHPSPDETARSKPCNNIHVFMNAPDTCSC